MLMNSQIIKTVFEKQIGNGTINKAQYPLYFFYDYSVSAHIIKRAETGVNNKCWITGIRFFMDRSGTGQPDSAKSQSVFLGQVNQDEFDVNVRNDMTQVPFNGWSVVNLQECNGNVNFQVRNPGWVETKFRNDYNYDPLHPTHKNLLVLWVNDDGSGRATSTSPWAESFSDGTFRSYYDFQDNTPPAGTDYGTRDNTGSPNIQLIFEV